MKKYIRPSLLLSFIFFCLVILIGACKKDKGGITGPSSKADHNKPAKQSMIIKNVTPEKGSPGTRITISGTNFMQSLVQLSPKNVRPSFSGNASKIKPERNERSLKITPSSDEAVNMESDSIKISDLITVLIGEEKAPVLRANDTLLVTKVPTNATNGIIKITVAEKTVSWDKFILISDLQITSLSPESGSPKTSVTLNGSGFSLTPDSNAVAFNGTDATVTKADSTTLEVIVPKEATTGPVTVQVGERTATGPDFTVIKSLTFTSSSSFKVDENTKAVGTVTAEDLDGNPITYSISGGDDQDQFDLDGQSGQLTFNAAPDYEAPADADSDNLYLLQVQASDGNNTIIQDVTVTVQNLNDNPPVITQSTYEIEENKTEIGTIAANDPDGDELTYELNNGVDVNFFNLDSQTGALSFKYPRDYENPRDGGGRLGNVPIMNIKLILP